MFIGFLVSVVAGYLVYMWFCGYEKQYPELAARARSTKRRKAKSAARARERLG